VNLLGLLLLLVHVNILKHRLCVIPSDVVDNNLLVLYDITEPILGHLPIPATAICIRVEDVWVEVPAVATQIY
jgi:hypothetical protein